jgi:hypothetical protein
LELFDKAKAHFDLIITDHQMVQTVWPRFGAQPQSKGIYSKTWS